MTDSNLVEHARRELAIINEDPEFAGKLVEMVKIFASMGHSGGSAAVATAMLNELLQLHNLSPLTDHPCEWHHYDEGFWGEKGGIWQNTRNGEAFSSDGGKTYYLLHENVDRDAKKIMHTSRVSEKVTAG